MISAALASAGGRQQRSCETRVSGNASDPAKYRCTKTGAPHCRFARSSTTAAAARRHSPVAELVVDTVEIPLPREKIAREPADRAIGQRDVPLIACPRVRVPPLARDTPRSGASDHTRLRSERAAHDAGTTLAVGDDAHAP